jgi:predicted transcriptional regulator
MAEIREQLIVRVPPALKKSVSDIAHQNRRSMTREVQAVLERHVAKQKSQQQSA